MSALGQKQTFALQNVMSALPPKADMCSATRHVRFVPIADIISYSIPRAFRSGALESIKKRVRAHRFLLITRGQAHELRLILSVGVPKSA